MLCYYLHNQKALGKEGSAEVEERAQQELSAESRKEYGMVTLTTYMYVHVHDSFRYKKYYLHDQQKDAEYLGRVGPGEIEESAW